jgi:hypothetical protein
MFYVIPERGKKESGACFVALGAKRPCEGVKSLASKGIEGLLAAQETTIDAIVAAFAKAGLEFIDGDEPGVKLRKPKGKRK